MDTITSKEKVLSLLNMGWRLSSQSNSYFAGYSDDERRRIFETDKFKTLSYGAESYRIDPSLVSFAEKRVDQLALIGKARDYFWNAAYDRQMAVHKEALEARQEEEAATNLPLYLSNWTECSYAIAADGSVTAGAENIQQPVADDVLLLSWEKGSQHSQHTFTVHQMPWGMTFITPQQEAAVQAIQEEIAKIWEGRCTAYLSPSMGMGWGITAQTHKIITSVDDFEMYFCEHAPEVRFEECSSEYFEENFNKFSFTVLEEKAKAEAEAQRIAEEEAEAKAQAEEEARILAEAKPASTNDLAALMAKFGK